MYLQLPMGHHVHNSFVLSLIYRLAPSPFLVPPELEWMLSETGCVKTALEEDPRKSKKIRDVMSIAVKQNTYHDAEDSDADSDWYQLIH